MKLYILRHGHAPSPAEAGVTTDSERPLSDLGRQATLLMARHLASAGGRPDLILHSPLRRAVETAREASLVLKPRQGLEEFEPLANVLPGPELVPLLRERRNLRELLVVGHQPQLGDLAAALSGQGFDLATSGLIALEVPPQGRARLLWSRNPKDLPADGQAPKKD